MYFRKLGMNALQRFENVTCQIQIKRYLNTFQVAGVSRRQVHHFIKFSKMFEKLNFMTIFGITMGNAFKVYKHAWYRLINW